VLFNRLHGRPLVALSADEAKDLEQQLAEMERELRGSGVAHAEALASLLKMLLIKATRLKLEQEKLPPAVAQKRAPAVLERLVELVEKDFRSKHRPAEYAAALHMSSKGLGKLVKAHFGRTLTELIRERVMRYAKWQLLHTQRPVKEIAWELGFADEFYFSRLFKRATGGAPRAFREFETEIRGGRNLSM
jgi:AraC-like DNA-binding protein